MIKKLLINPIKSKNDKNMTEREYWIDKLDLIANPVLTSLARKQLKENMPVEVPVESVRKLRETTSHLEAFGRTLAGISPWLEVKDPPHDEKKLINKYALLSRQAIDAATDPDSPDFMNFSPVNNNHQPLVDAAFLSHAILRAPTELWIKLDNRIKENVINALKRTRECFAHYNNWLLFPAMIEVVMFKIGEESDKTRIDYALKQHQQWYIGDGTYSDGPEFHMDYYNSFVIQPMMVDIISTIAEINPAWKSYKKSIISRAKRYAGILERMISPEGTFPVIGRSLAYRFGVFQLLAQMALQNNLPDDISPSQVRCALTAVIRRLIEAPGTFDQNGWLKLGLYGSQPNISETYISTGSLYLCSTVFLPLGLSPQDPFWSDEPMDWSAKKVWSGKDLKCDVAYREK